MRLTYLDHAAGAPVRPVAREAAVRAWERAGLAGANPASAHAAGREAAFLLDDARARVAAALGADAGEVLFTSGATEAVVLALRGAAARGPGAQIIHTALDHPAVAETAASLGDVVVIGLDGTGGIDPGSLAAALAGPQPAAVAATAVSSETGVIVPVDSLVAGVRRSWGPGVPLLVDATQAIGRLDVDFHALGADLLALSGHKFGAPAGTGVLLATRDVALAPVLTGGGQERGLRAGTPDVAGAQALACALEAAVGERVELERRHRDLRERLLAGLPEGVEVATSAPSVPAITMCVAPGCRAEPLLLALDAAGIAVSAGSACHTGVARPSPALLAQGLDEMKAAGALRVSLGWSSTSEDIDAFVRALPGALEAAHAFGAV